MLGSTFEVLFFKLETGFGLRISDGGSDVCSSDLQRGARRPHQSGRRHHGARRGRLMEKLLLPAFAGPVHAAQQVFRHALNALSEPGLVQTISDVPGLERMAPEIGRASCRERVCQYV